MHVLVVHSDPRFYREVQPLLADQEASGAYQPSLEGLGSQVEAHFPDLIVLEHRCLLKDENKLGEAFARSSRLPLIFLTRATSERIRAGEERNRLVAILGHLRNQSGRVRANQILQVGQLRIHAGRMRVAVGDRWVKLPPIQFRILHYLALHANQVIPHRELMHAVWGYSATDEEARDLLKVHITQVRRKLGAEFKHYIQAIRGQGYVLVDPDADE